jgi:F420H(2)-dependent quinone reductase
VTSRTFRGRHPVESPIAATDRLTGWRRLVNAVVRVRLRVGVGPSHTSLLTVTGRRSGRLYTTPVTLVEDGGRRWLVAPHAMDDLEKGS